MYAVAQENTTGRRSIALVLTLAIHAGLLLFFILWKIITPVPPFPEHEGGGAGLELSLGFTELGMGDNSRNPDPAPAAATPTPPAPADESSIVTNDVDDSPVAAPEKPVTKPKPVRTEPKPVVTKPQPTQEQLEQQRRDRLVNAWNTPGKGAEGKGDSDVPGTAGGNEGTEDGRGIGNGTGSYRGDGWSVDLAGRTIRKKPVINEKPSVGGKVVMDIWVNAEGKVVRTAQNTAKSTTLDQTLVSLARRAVLESSFYPDPKASGEKTGTMTFTFTLR